MDEKEDDIVFSRITRLKSLGFDVEHTLKSVYTIQGKGRHNCFLLSAEQLREWDPYDLYSTVNYYFRFCRSLKNRKKNQKPNGDKDA